AGAERPRLDQFADLRGRPRRRHRPLGRLHQDDLQIGLALGPDRQPAEAAVHGVVGAHLHPQLVAVERQGLVLVQHPDRHVAHFPDHVADLLGRPGTANAGPVYPPPAPPDFSDLATPPYTLATPPGWRTPAPGRRSGGRSSRVPTARARRRARPPRP